MALQCWILYDATQVWSVVGQQLDEAAVIVLGLMLAALLLAVVGRSLATSAR